MVLEDNRDNRNNRKNRRNCGMSRSDIKQRQLILPLLVMDFSASVFTTIFPVVPVVPVVF